MAEKRGKSNPGDQQEKLSDRAKQLLAESIAEQLDEEGQEPVESESDPIRQPILPIRARVSALLFVSPRPLAAATIAEAVGVQEEKVLSALSELREIYQEEIHGVVLTEVSGGWQLRTSARAAEFVTRLYQPKGRRLSRAAAETLAIIAYKQPIQRADVEAIRGVDALPTLKTLLDYKLVRVVGKESAPGHPVLYGTTQLFLETFGLRDLTELPPIKEMSRLATEPGEAGVEGSASGDDLDDAEHDLEFASEDDVSPTENAEAGPLGLGER